MHSPCCHFCCPCSAVPYTNTGAGYFHSTRYISDYCTQCLCIDMPRRASSPKSLRVTGKNYIIYSVVSVSQIYYCLAFYFQLPEHIEHADLTDILNDAHNKRTARSIRRQIAAHRVCQCEGNLQILREALQHADRDLAEVNSTIGALQDLFQHTSPAPTTSVEGLHTQHVGTFYDSGASDGSISTRSEASFSGAAG
jgi:hypothetical protein